MNARWLTLSVVALVLVIAPLPTAELAGAPAESPSPPDPVSEQTHVPFDPLSIRPGKPWPGAGYPWVRTPRTPPAGWIAAEPPPGVDLDVTFISRTPTYKAYCVDYPAGIPILCSGTEGEKRWPDPGELVAFTAHIVNKGTVASPDFAYRWFIDGIEVASGTLGELIPGAETTATTQWAWAHTLDGERVVGDHTVRFTVDPQNTVAETCETNNTLADRTDALGFRIGITPDMVAAYNTPWNPAFSFSAEDWLQRQITAMNWALENAVYPTTPAGATERVRIDRIEITSAPPINDRTSDGGWFVDADYRTYSGGYDPTTDIDWSLVHELSHQVGLIDLYQLDIAATSVKVLDAAGMPANFGFEWPRWGIMGGGDIAPHTDHNLYSSHSAAGISANKGYRRGYYGEYQYDVPEQNTMLVLDHAGHPAAEVAVALYQRTGPPNWAGELELDNVPEISGVTGPDGRFPLTNRPAGRGATTHTGHTLRDNPFGVIDVVGGRNRFLVRLSKGDHEEFAWLEITAFNLAYWQGDTASHTITLASHVPTAGAPATPGGLIGRVEGNRTTLSWLPGASPGIVGYHVYRAGPPTYAYERISGLVTDTSYEDHFGIGGHSYAVTAVSGTGSESGFSRFVWAPAHLIPGDVDLLPGDMRIVLNTHTGGLLQQNADGRYVQRLNSPHFSPVGAQFLAVDPDGRFLLTEPGSHQVRVADAQGSPTFAFGGPGSGPGQFQSPAGIAVWGRPCTVEGPYAADAHTLLLLHFDGSYAGADGEPGTPNGTTFVGGKYGQGVLFDGGDTLHYPTAGNLNRTAGAVEFWLQPIWNGDDEQGYTFFEVGDEWLNRLRITKDGANNLRLIVWDNITEYGVAYNVAHWRAGEWRHVAATWAGSEIALYTDGVERDRSTMASPPARLADAIHIGSTAWGDAQANGVMDEVRISDSARVGNSDTCSYRVVVADSGNHRIQAFDAAGRFITAYGSAGAGPGQFIDPQGVAVDAAGRVIVADSGNHRVQLLSFDGTDFGFIRSLTAGFAGPTGVTAYGADRILVADTGNNTIKAINVTNGLLVTGYTGPTDGHAGPFDAPRAAIGEPDGDLVVADTGNGRVAVIRGALPTLTLTPTVPPTPTPTSRPTRTPTPTPTPTGCSERVNNAGFEVDAAWTFPVTASRAGYTTAQAHTGHRSARFGVLPGLALAELSNHAGSGAEQNLLGEIAPANASYSSGYQTVSIPAAVDTATLTFWYKPGTQATSGDFQRVMLLNPNGYTYIATLMKVLENVGVWQKATFDLAPFRGQSIVLYFEVYNDNISAGPRTWMFLDDVSLLACTAAPTPTPSATPSPPPGITGYLPLVLR